MSNKTKSLVILSDPKKGENIFHCWNATESFYVYIQKGKHGIDQAFTFLKKKFGTIYLSVAHAAHKNEIKYYL